MPTAPLSWRCCCCPKWPQAKPSSLNSQHGSGDGEPLNHEPLVELQDEIESLQASIDRLDREVFISAVDTPNAYSEWMGRWRHKVEVMGNRYAKTQQLNQLFGEVLLAVSIKADGRIHAIKVLNSSGKPALDEAALHIAEFAGPFEPLPEIIREEVDVLHITRTWRFTAVGTSVAF